MTEQRIFSKQGHELKRFETPQKKSKRNEKSLNQSAARHCKNFVRIHFHQLDAKISFLFKTKKMQHLIAKLSAEKMLHRGS